MPVTPLNAFGRLSMEYTAGRLRHKAQFWVDTFGPDVSVGTFSNTTPPVSMSALADELANLIKPLYTSDTPLAFGSWIGEKHELFTDESMIPVNSGTITAPTASYGTGSNPALDVSQITWTFRVTTGKLLRHVFFGAHYLGPQVLLYGDLSGGYKDYADYVLGSSHIFSRGLAVPSALISVAFDTNDEVTRKFRR